jgi:hypothetical protein
MSDPNDKRKTLAPFRRELETASISRPQWLLDAANSASSETVPKAIPQGLLDAILDVIAYSIQQVLAEVLARCVTTAVDRATRPLAEEVALLRVAIEHDWSRATGRNHELYAKKGEDGKE